MTIHDPEVAVTDLALAILAAYLGWRLWTTSGNRRLQRAGAVLLGALAGAALWGSIFHAFFPAGTATLPGSLAWMAVALSIVVAAATMLDLGLSLLLPQLPPRLRRPVVLTYAGGFAAVVVLMDDSFTRIVYFYLPTLILLLLASAQQAVRCRSAGWTLILTGLLLSAGAAMLQQARVALHPVYFDTTRSTTWCRASRSCSSTSDGAVRPTRRWHLAGEVSLSSLPDHVQPRKDQRA